MTRMRQWIWASGLGLVFVLLAVPSQAKDEVERIEEKAAELSQKIQSERFSHMGEGKESNLDRVYKDFDYLLKESKNEVVEQAIQAKSGAEADRLRRLDHFLLDGRIFAPVAASFDNAHSYQATSSMAVGNVEITLDNIELLLSNESGRSNRRIWYLASRDLRENYNVFEINLHIDLDRRSKEITGKSYPQFLADEWGFDPATVQGVCEAVLEGTRSEYMELLPQVIDDAFDDLSLEDFREYDRPFLLRAEFLDGTFESKKVEDTADKWLKEIGLSVKSARKMRVVVDDRDGMALGAKVFPISPGNDVRVSMVPIGGLPDYWRLFGALGEAQFHYHIDSSQPFEYQSLGSPLVPMVYGALYQQVLADPNWRAKYLKVKNDEAAIDRAIRFRQLFELRQNAARYLFQLRLHEDNKVPPAEYAALMQETLGYSHGSTEETNYLTSEDLHESGLRVWASVLGAQLADRFASLHGEEWWSKGEVGKWLRDQWSKGYRPSSGELAQALEVGSTDPAAVTHP